MKETGEAVRVSHTEATLDARGAFKGLRELAQDASDALREAIGSEVDRLVDVLTDAYHARDGMVPDEVLATHQKESDDEIEKLEGKLQEAEDEIDVLETRVETLEEILRETESLENDPHPPGVPRTSIAPQQSLQARLVDLLKKQVDHEAQINAMKAKLDAANDHVKQVSKEAAADRAARGAAEIRMASWLMDRTAAETADHYREKYEAASREVADLHDRFNAAIETAKHRAGKRKTMLAGIASVRGVFLWGRK